MDFYGGDRYVEYQIKQINGCSWYIYYFLLRNTIERNFEWHICPHKGVRTITLISSKVDQSLALQLLFSDKIIPRFIIFKPN